MRVVSAIGAAVFAYLALIPFSLLASTLDSSCAGSECETALPITVVLVILYGACLLALAGMALVFADHAARGRPESLAREPGALRICSGVVGVTLFFLFCVLTPIGGLVVTAIGVLTLRLMHRYNERHGDGDPGAGDPHATELRRRAGNPPPNPNLN